MIVKNNIQAILDKQGKTQASLARDMGVSDTTINRMVSGRVSNVTVITAIKIMDALGIKDIKEVFYLTNVNEGSK